MPEWLLRYGTYVCGKWAMRGVSQGCQAAKIICYITSDGWWWWLCAYRCEMVVGAPDVRTQTQLWNRDCVLVIGNIGEQFLLLSSKRLTPSSTPNSVFFLVASIRFCSVHLNFVASISVHTLCCLNKFCSVLLVGTVLSWTEMVGSGRVHIFCSFFSFCCVFWIRSIKINRKWTIKIELCWFCSVFRFESVFEWCNKISLRGIPPRTCR